MHSLHNFWRIKLIKSSSESSKVPKIDPLIQNFQHLREVAPSRPSQHPFAKILQTILEIPVLVDNRNGKKMWATFFQCRFLPYSVYMSTTIWRLRGHGPLFMDINIYGLSKFSCFKKIQIYWFIISLKFSTKILHYIGYSNLWFGHIHETMKISYP